MHTATTEYAIRQISTIGKVTEQPSIMSDDQELSKTSSKDTNNKEKMDEMVADADIPPYSSTKEPTSPRRVQIPILNTLPPNLEWKWDTDKVIFQKAFPFSIIAGDIYTKQEILGILISPGWLYEVVP